LIYSKTPEIPLIFLPCCVLVIFDAAPPYLIDFYCDCNPGVSITGMQMVSSCVAQET